MWVNKQINTSFLALSSSFQLVELWILDISSHEKVMWHMQPHTPGPVPNELIDSKGGHYEEATPEEEYKVKCAMILCNEMFLKFH